MEPVESDPAVTSTVGEIDIPDSETSGEKTEVANITRPPFWRFSQTKVEKVIRSSDSEAPETTTHEFEVPEFEFDDEHLDLQGDLDDAFLDIEDNDDLIHGRITPDGFIDEDFEHELGWSEKELCIQDVIDADFRDISRLGILQVGGNDLDGRKVIAFFACRLPPSDLIDHDRLLQYVTKTLEQYVSSFYTLVYFHWGLTSQNKPAFPWLVRAYQTFGRSFKKNLKSLVVVYPTRTVRVLWSLFAAFVSVKMNKKLHYVNNLRELESYVPVRQLNLPLRIRDYDNRIRPFGAPLRMDPAAASIIGGHDADDAPLCEHQQFGTTLQHIKAINGGRKIPVVVEDTITYLRGYGLNTHGLFIKPTNATTLRDVQTMYNQGEYVDLCEFDDPHLAAHLLKSFLQELKEPILTYDLYDDVLKSCSKNWKILKPTYPNTRPCLRPGRGRMSRNRVNAIRHLLTVLLPRDNYDILFYIFKFLTEILEHSSKNMMTAANLSVALAPSLIWSRHQIVIPSSTTQGLIVSFTQLCITHFESIFTRA
uniref:Rho-GAP domain-containing protein n=1 Tax=Mesocestoides corti TaxID=53468 RepID=A0A5K3EVY3_MESCO